MYTTHVYLILDVLYMCMNVHVLFLKFIYIYIRLLVFPFFSERSAMSFSRFHSLTM